MSCTIFSGTFILYRSADIHAWQLQTYAIISLIRTVWWSQYQPVYIKGKCHKIPINEGYTTHYPLIFGYSTSGSSLALWNLPHYQRKTRHVSQWMLFENCIPPWIVYWDTQCTITVCFIKKCFCGRKVEVFYLKQMTDDLVNYTMIN